MMTPRNSPPRLLPVVLSVLAGFSHATTDISTTPLITNEVSVKSNLMFVLDNSGSMDEGALPNDVASPSFVGYRSAQCNGAAFNESGEYLLPLTADNRPYPNMSITAAWTDGFIPDLNTVLTVDGSLNTVVPDAGLTQTVVVTGVSTSATPYVAGNTIVVQKTADNTHWMIGRVLSVSGAGTTRRTLSVAFSFSSAYTGSVSGWRIGKPNTVDLTSSSGGSDPDASFYYNYTGSQPAMSWAYNSRGALISPHPFNDECTSTGTPSGFTEKKVSSLTGATRQNYANWFSYHRKRILMMRTAAGRAMAGLDNSFRVGFSTLNNGTSVNTTVTPTLGLFANIADYNEAQRLIFFSNLYGAKVAGGTPLRQALAKAGQYYGGVIPGQTDPVINACQRNYTLLTTDGYWNDASLPRRLDRSTTIGNNDGNIARTPRPIYDGTADAVRVEQRTRYVADGRCGFFNTRYEYRAIRQERTITSPTSTTGTITSDWEDVEETTPLCISSSTTPATTAVTVTNRTGGESNTLADVAAYYYQTDLRPSMPNSVRELPTDPARHQHMNTYTLGLGVSGLLRYDPNYLTQTEGDFADIKAGRKVWPRPGDSDAAKVDDLWHAAINGYGRYFSANNASNLAESLINALNDINARPGAGASAASSSLRPVLGTDQIFIASYRTRFWDGELEARTISQGLNNTVSVDSSTSAWKASALLDATPYADRKIYFMGRQNAAAGGTNVVLRDFTHANLSSDADASQLLSHFDNFCTRSPQPTQCPALTSAQRSSASGVNLVNFIRGDRSNEGSLYRSRESVLGSMVESSPVFVGKPPFSYQDVGYSAFAQAEAQLNRCPMVYVGANDGMLHAFSAKTNQAGCQPAGSEVWAYVPRGVMSNLYMLADSDYINRHRFYVNATPIVGDISRPSANDGTPSWRTILVGGFGAGGRGYYALDITSPSSPQAMWEFTDADMGLSYGNPIITKVPDSNGTPTWVVVFTSGLNNSGNGFLYVLNANTGTLMYKVPTLVNGAAVGTASAPSGLNKLNAWVDRPTDNTAVRFYATDMLGNVWRFKSDNLAPATGPDTRAVRLAQLSTGGVAQPITTRPELAEILYAGSRHAVVFVGTGRYLGLTDVSTTGGRQSVYGIKDPLGDTGWGNPRAQMIEQRLQTSADGQSRTVSRNTVDWSSSNVAGWYIDLADAGERVAVNMSLAFTTLTLATIVPEQDVCSGSGYSWLYDLNITSGSFIKDREVDQTAGERRGDPVMGINNLQIEGDPAATQILTNSNGTVSVKKGGNSLTSTGANRRVSWRELLPGTR